MTSDVAIIGVGLHPFGRFDKTAMQMGAEAIQSALADAGVGWKDIQFGFGGSHEVSNPDAVTRLVGLTGITFTNVFNACATAASAIQQTADTIRLGKYDIGIAVGLDKHPRGAFTDDPAKLALPQWYAQNGQFVTTKFFGIKANRYLHDHGISEETLARVANKNFRNGVLNPNAFRRKEISIEEIMASPVLNYPLRQYMFCAPDEGAAAVIMCRADIAHKYTDKPVYVRASEIRTRTYGAYEVHATFAPLDEDVSPTVYAAKAAYEAAGIGPEDVDIAQLQDTDAGAETETGGGGTWFLDLEQAGIVQIVGDPSVGSDLIRFIGAELFVNPWNVTGEIGPTTMRRIADVALAFHCDVLAVMPTAALAEHEPVIVWTGEGHLIQLTGVPRHPVHNAAKRLTDIVIALVALVVAAPLLAVLAALVMLESPGSPIFRHSRVGFRGRKFDCLKLRTMRADAETMLRTDPQMYESYRQNHFKIPDARDPRVTRIGRFLRRTSLDELPQLWNILKGEMSLVGPRPVVEEELALYGDDKDLMLSVRPGLTGAWAVSGRQSVGYPERCELELGYVRDRTMLRDAQIIVQTAAVVMGIRGRFE